MRILSVTASYAPFLEFGGPPVKVRALAEGLARRGHSVTVLTPDWGIEKRLSETDGLAERSPFGWKREEGGVASVYLPTWWRHRALSWNPAAKRFCRQQLLNFDVVHVFGLYDLLGPGVATACRARGIPYVVEPIGMFLPIVRSIWLKRMYHALWGRRLLDRAAAVVATSEQEVEELGSGGVPRAKITLRRNGVESPGYWPEKGAFRRKLGIPDDAKLLLFLGRLSWKKSPELLLKAAAALPALQDREQRIVFAGPDEGGVGRHLMEMARHLGIAGKVSLVGPVYEEAKWAAYRDADVFVLPSQNENFGNSALEAVVAGTPVIVTERCGVSPFLADKAGLVVAHEVEALSAALTRMLSEPGLRVRLAHGCADVASRLGWDDPVREMEALYARIADKTPKRVREAGA